MYQFITITSIFCLSCTQQPTSYFADIPTKTSTGDTIPIPNFRKPDYDYVESRTYVERRRKALKDAFDLGQISADSVGKAFTQSLLCEIIPYWYGTHWTFTGHTETPGQGDISCGYFVSTTLRHVGLQLNRYRLAQQSPIDEALMLSLGDTVIVTQRDNAEKALGIWRTKLRDGLYFIGLGQGHVGFLLKHKTEFYLIHSNYMGPVEVQIQRTEESVFMGFQDFYLADITFNQRLIEHWMNGEVVNLQNEGVQIRW